MDNPGTWLGVAVALIVAVRGEWQAYQARKSKCDDAEEARLAAKDRLEFDAKMIRLTTENEAAKATNTALAAKVDTLTLAVEDERLARKRCEARLDALEARKT